MSDAISKKPSFRTATNDVEIQKSEVLVGESADIALQYLVNNDRIEYTEEDAQRVRWKIDLYLLPILALTFGLQYLDKVTISYAAVYGMRADLNLVGQQYSWATSLFYFGYMIGEFPANYLLQKLPIGKFAATNLLIWGMLVMLCSTAKNFAGLAVLRFLMGVFESCIGPCWVQITGMYYKGEEQGTRVTVWYSMVGVAAIVGGLLSYGIGHINAGVAQWQLVFLICGGFTIVWSFIVLFFLPDTPLNARFLTSREKAIAIERLRSNRTGLKTSVFKWSQAVEAFKDPQIWMITFISGIGNICNIGGSFLPLIIKDLGFTGLTTTLLTLPVGGVEIVAMFAAGFAALYCQNWRTVIMFTICLPTLAGTVMLQVLPQSSTWGRASGVWLLLCLPASYAILLSLISSNVAGFSKKITTTFLVFVFLCVGNIVSPQLFIATEAPKYKTGCAAMLVAIVLVLALTAALGSYYVWENKRRDRILASTPPEVVAAMSMQDEEFLDRTDKEDFLKFRYRW